MIISKFSVVGGWFARAWVILRPVHTGRGALRCGRVTAMERREPAKSSQQQLKPRLLELVGKLERPSISELHRALLQSENLSYGAVANAMRTLVQEGRLGRVES